MNDTDFTDFVTAYLEAGLWSTLMPDDWDGCGGGNGHMDARYDIDDCANRADVEAECRDFLTVEVVEVLESLDGTWDQHGHDFLLTRDGHGTGFWDRGYPEETGRWLTDQCRPYGDSSFMPECIKTTEPNGGFDDDDHFTDSDGTVYKFGGAVFYCEGSRP